MRKRSGQVHSRESSATLQLTVSLLYLDERGSFIVKLYKDVMEQTVVEMDRVDNRELLRFCKTPRTRKEISDYLGLNSVTYAIQTRVMPLVERGIIKMSIPEKPKSPKQLFYCD